jgi:hypothetical protein
LIETLGLLAEFDGEQGLHAAVHVEGLTGPAGSNSLGVAMLETVYRRKLIKLLAAAECEVQVPRQVFLVDPPIARLPIRFGKHPNIVVPGDADPALMDRGVMPPA